MLVYILHDLAQIVASLFGVSLDRELEVAIGDAASAISRAQVGPTRLARPRTDAFRTHVQHRVDGTLDALVALRLHVVTGWAGDAAEMGKQSMHYCRTLHDCSQLVLLPRLALGFSTVNWRNEFDDLHGN